MRRDWKSLFFQWALTHCDAGIESISIPTSRSMHPNPIEKIMTSGRDATRAIYCELGLINIPVFKVIAVELEVVSFIKDCHFVIKSTS